MNEVLLSNQTIIVREGGAVPNQPGGSGKGCLIKIYPAGVGEGLIDLPSGRFIIGRAPECNLVLPDSTVSRQHAIVEPTTGSFVISDQKSTNGTFVNDSLVSRRVLSPGDFIRIGKYILKFLAADHIEAQYHETIYSMMITDGLTAAHNKRHFLAELERELVRSQRHRRPLSLVMFDIDHFKKINDDHGHLAGDAVLRELCNRIRPTIRKDEVLARYGGEEFIVLLPESTAEDARGFAERLRRLVAESPIPAGDLLIPMTVSVGIAQTLGDRPLSSDDLISEADRNLYEAKRSGRNRVFG